MQQDNRQKNIICNKKYLFARYANKNRANTPVSVMLMLSEDSSKTFFFFFQCLKKTYFAFQAN